MAYRNLMTIFGAISVLVGLIFGFYPVVAYGPSPLYTSWAMHEPGNLDAVSIWQGVTFIRMFGVTLTGFGCLILGLREIQDATTRRAVSSAMIVASAVISLMALCQAIAIWPLSQRTLPKTLPYFFLAWLLAFSWLRFAKRGNLAYSTPISPNELLQSKWERQIRATAAQEERNRLARDLHDSIKQQVFTINISAATAQARMETDPPGALRALDDMRQGAREAMAEMEALLQHLRPAPLENVGLIEAIRKQCEALQYRTGAEVVTEFGELPESKRLQPGAQEAIFRITQESLANIARHARAENVRVRLHQTDDRNGSLWLKISDDGKGFDAAYPPSGSGLTNIRERAQEIGGRLALESSPGAGTQMILEIPLQESELPSIRRRLYFAVVKTFLIALALLIGLQFEPSQASPLYLTAAILYLSVLYRLTNVYRTINRLEADPDISRSALRALRRSTFQVFAFLYMVLLLASFQQILAHAHKNGNHYPIAFLFMALGIGVPVLEQLRQIRKFLSWNPASDTRLEIQRKLIEMQRQALRNFLLPLPFFYILYRMTGNWMVGVFAASLLAWIFYPVLERKNLSVEIDRDRLAGEAGQ